MLLKAEHTRLLSDSSSAKSVIANLVILADAVFGISSSGAERYLSGLWSVCRVNRLPRRNCFNLVTTNTMASAFRLCSSSIAPLESTF